MSLVLNGKVISIAEYASLIIEAAKRIIEREQQGSTALSQQQRSTTAHTKQESRDMAHNTMQDNGMIGYPEEGTPVDAQGVTESQSTETPYRDGQTTDVSSVLLRLPDGSLQTVEEYIMNIIRDASSQVEEDHSGKESTTTQENAKSQEANSDTGALATPSSPDCKDITKCKKPSKVKKTTSISKVFSRIFHRGKSKDQSDKEEKDISQDTNNLSKESCPDETEKPEVSSGTETERENIDVQTSIHATQGESGKSEEAQTTESLNVHEQTAELPITAGKGEESPTDKKEISQETPTDNKEISQETPTDNKEISQETPTDNKEISQETPTDKKEISQETPTDNKEISQETPTDNKEISKETPTSNKEIKSRKQHKKGNSFRKMLSCFSSKSAQVE